MTYLPLAVELIVTVHIRSAIDSGWVYHDHSELDSFMSSRNTMQQKLLDHH